jgi:hypothetical protein
VSQARRLLRKAQRAGQTKPHPVRKGPPALNVNYQELETKLLQKVLERAKDRRHPLDYLAVNLEQEARRILKTYGGASAEVSPTGRMTLHDPPVYVQAGKAWRRIPED